jgi:hypothetical protein
VRTRLETRRLWGLALVALLASAQAASWIHTTVVSHGICLEHGGWVHQPSAPARPASADRGNRHLAPAAAGDDAHEDCSAGAPLRWRDVVLETRATIAAGPAASTQTSLHPSHAPLRGTAVYLLAPKTSPPSPASS